jgi:hypothetical protein
VRATKAHRQHPTERQKQPTPGHHDTRPNTTNT